MHCEASCVPSGTRFRAILVALVAIPGDRKWNGQCSSAMQLLSVSVQRKNVEKDRQSGLVISREQGLRHEPGFSVPVLMSASATCPDPIFNTMATVSYLHISELDLNEQDLAALQNERWMSCLVRKPM